MRTHTERIRTIVRIGLAALVGAVAVVAALLSPAPPASAVVLPATHARLMASVPAADAVVPEVAAVALTFNREIAPPAAVAVTAPSGARVGTGEPVVAGKVVTLPVTAAEQGTYTVGYRAVSVDGHPITGRFTFSVGHRGRPYTAPTREQSGDGIGAPVVAGGLALVTATAGLWWWWWRRRSA